MKTSTASLFMGVALAFAATGAAHATEEVVFGCWGGASEKTFTEKILPPFEQANDVKVRYVPGVSTYFTAQLQARRQSPEMDVVCQDDGPQSVARELGLLAPYDKAAIPALGDAQPLAMGVDDVGVGYGLLAMGIVYALDALKEAGIEPPASWNDLADARFKDRIVMMGIDGTPGLQALIMLARANGGDENNIEPGFEKMKEVSKNVFEFAKSSDMSKYFQQNEAWVSVWTNAEMLRYVKSSGFNLKFVYPTEGAPIVMPMLSLVQGAPHKAMGEKLVDYLMSVDQQVNFAKNSKLGPVNQQAKLEPADAEGLVYGDVVSKLYRPNWSVINAKRPEWTERWNREIEK